MIKSILAPKRGRQLFENKTEVIKRITMKTWYIYLYNCFLLRMGNTQSVSGITLTK